MACPALLTSTQDHRLIKAKLILPKGKICYTTKQVEPTKINHKNSHTYKANLDKILREPREKGVLSNLEMEPYNEFIIQAISKATKQNEPKNKEETNSEKCILSDEIKNLIKKR